MDWRMMLLATREVKFSVIIGDEITSPLYTIMKENLRKTNQKANDAIFEREYIYKNGMELSSDLDTYSQEESSSEEESKAEEIREIENATEQKDVIEIKRGNEAEEPENRSSKEASPSLEQHEDEYFVHLSNAESDDELKNQQKSEQFINTEKILKEIAEETKPTMISTPEQKKGDKKPTHILPQVIVQTDGLHDTLDSINKVMSDTSSSEDEIQKNSPKRVRKCTEEYLANRAAILGQKTKEKPEIIR
ncbi:hypothetical protein JTB14_031856 [Gonioctena quinquepunctata]|nr:hypothetical protein JTB14_031856 [Gonioctena quinquepunctata]